MAFSPSLTESLNRSGFMCNTMFENETTRGEVMGTIRTLILSGGGGRGAFHAGVYRYLSQNHKPGVTVDHQGQWKPDIVVGTSIGAVNGAAIVQGMSADELLAFWRSLRERDIQGLPPNMTRFSRWIMNQVFKNMIGVSLPTVLPADATSPTPEQSWLPLPGLGKLGAIWLGRWANLLDTGPLRRTIIDRLGLDEAKINASTNTLLINATNVSTGQRVTFSNRLIYRRGSTQQRPDVLPGITIQRIIASCSIPLIYPWTFDELSQNTYWDGAVVANTPLGVSLAAANDYPAEDVMEVVVVLMTPWREGSLLIEDGRPLLPRNFAEAITWVLDWALLATFRERLDLIHAYNRLGEIGRRIGDPELAGIRQVRVVIVAPQDFFPAARIIDYDEHTDHLIQLGYQAAECAFQKHFQKNNIL
jgi:NTE family protein